MIDDLIASAGPVPARAPAARWHQVALLATAAALGANGRVQADLAGVLQALDAPTAAAEAARLGNGDPWGRWWGTLAAGQHDGATAEAAVHAALALPREPGPDGRDVLRRLMELRDELAVLRGDAEAQARFSLQGITLGGPDRRALLVGRSSAAFLVEPAWDTMRLIRLAPSEGPSAGNRAHLTLGEIIEAIRRGDRGADRAVPPDSPTQLAPEALLAGLREDRGVRDRRLLDLADEVRTERDRLAAEREQLREQKLMLASALRQAQAIRDEGAATVTTRVPGTRAEAAALLEVPVAASAEDVEKAFRAQVVRCHPDRVAGLHPTIRGQAEGLTVALNAARELLLG
ncbi:MAG: J domain-containing protein [Thermoleophilia bacterium]